MDLQNEIDCWKRLLSAKRLNDIKSGKANAIAEDPRNPFQRDCDRITYSYPFRRLQDKTQVIPLPVVDFVHTRLTHSLEVATVGRSFGILLENFLIDKKILEINDKGTISAILTAACLAHDIGNPPFGHSGEDSISEYFNFGYGRDKLMSEYFDESDRISDVAIHNECKIKDLQNFEGNAMGFRLLTKYEDNGLNLTCAVLATFTKYPRQSYILGENESNKKWNTERVSQKKYGFFQSEIEEFKIVAAEVGLKELQDPSSGNLSWARHPLAFLMEAADDICYGIIDLEDGYRIGRIPFKEAESSLKAIAVKDSRFNLGYYEELEGKEKQQFGYLRAVVINVLIMDVFEAFKRHYYDIIAYNFDKDLIMSSQDETIINSLKEIKDIVRKYVYKWQEVLTIEASGFEILGSLLSEYISASNVHSDGLKRKRELKILDLIAEEYRHTEEDDLYQKYLKIACYVSGMTDSFAINLFQKIKGIKAK